MFYFLNSSKYIIILLALIFSKIAINAEFSFDLVKKEYKIFLGGGFQGSAYLSLYNDPVDQENKLLVYKEIRLPNRPSDTWLGLDNKIENKFTEVTNEICANYELRGSPLIANSFGVFFRENKLIVAMEPVLGASLSIALKYLKEKPQFINSQWIRLVIARVALGIEYLHQKQWIWKDAKGDNIFIDYQTGYTKIGDFGISKRVNENTSNELDRKGIDWTSLGSKVIYPLYHLVESSNLPLGSLLEEMKEAMEKLRPSWKGTEYVPGEINSLNGIKKLALFNNFDWQGAKNGDIASGFIPKDHDDYLKVAFEEETALIINDLSNNLALMGAGSVDGFSMGESLLVEINKIRPPGTKEIRSAKDYCEIFSSPPGT